jgi:molybdopterin converting factor small subunit
LPSIQLEFFGVARSRTNVAEVTLDVECLRDALLQVCQRFPSLSELCVVDDQLAAGWLLNVNGTAFTRDLKTALHDGDSVLLIPADAGG